MRALSGVRRRVAPLREELMELVPIRFLIHGDQPRPTAARLEWGKLHFHVYSERLTAFQIAWNGEHRYTHGIRLEWPFYFKVW